MADIVVLLYKVVPEIRYVWYCHNLLSLCFASAQISHIYPIRGHFSIQSLSLVFTLLIVVSTLTIVGVYGYPNEAAADVALSVTRDMLEEHSEQVWEVSESRFQTTR